MSEALHPAAPHHLPAFITAPGDTDILMVVVGIVLLGSILMVGNFYLHLHTMPERMAHKSQKLQFEIVAVLGLLALFTHNHLFWVIGLLLAMIDLPDFGTPLAQDRGIGRENRRRSTRRRRDPDGRRRGARGGRAWAGHDESRCGQERGAEPCLSSFSARC